MSDATPIQSLSVDGIRAALRDARDGDAPVRAVCDFVAGVDWSGMDGADAEVLRLLGELEHLTAEITDGDIDAEAFVGRVRLLESPAYASSQPGR